MNADGIQHYEETSVVRESALRELGTVLEVKGPSSHEALTRSLLKAEDASRQIGRARFVLVRS